LQRLLGIPATSKPNDPTCWHYAQGRLTIDLSKATELAKPGMALRFEGGDLPVRVLVVYGENEKYFAFQNRCTHMGHRRLDPVPGTPTVQCCSVNKSTYDLEGNKLYGPAPRAVTTYTTHLDGDQLVVMIS
jgi:nitrite reductase/ring-hydroxylating ferredoxin subunit